MRVEKLQMFLITAQYILEKFLQFCNKIFQYSLSSFAFQFVRFNLSVTFLVKVQTFTRRQCSSNNISCVSLSNAMKNTLMQFDI